MIIIGESRLIASGATAASIHHHDSESARVCMCNDERATGKRREREGQPNELDCALYRVWVAVAEPAA